MSNVSHYLSVKILTNNMCSVVLKGTCLHTMKQSVPYFPRQEV